MRHLFSLLLPFTIIPGLVTAQVALGPEVGVNACNYSTSSPSQMGGGIRAGGRADIVLGGHFNVQPGILYVNNNTGGSHLSGGESTTMIVRTIEVPLNIVYKANPSGVTTPFIGIGPYVGFNVGGKITIPGGDIVPSPTVIRSLRIGSLANDDIKMVDAGISFTAGLQLRNGLCTKILFQKGLTDLQPPNNTGVLLLKRVNFGFSLGYLFSAKHKAKPAPEKQSS